MEPDRPTLEHHLATFAQKIDAWWLDQMKRLPVLKKADLFKRYKIGTDKTFRRFCNRDFTDTASTLGAWELRYRTAWAHIHDGSVPVDSVSCISADVLIETERAAACRTQASTLREDYTHIQEHTEALWEAVKRRPSRSRDQTAYKLLIKIAAAAHAAVKSLT